MDHAPEIGARVRYSGYWGTCDGTVTKIHKTVRYDDADFDWEHDEGLPPVLGFAPETEWRVSVRPDTRPTWWVWSLNDSFVVDVFEVEILHSLSMFLK